MSAGRPISPLPIHPMQVGENGGRRFYLFYDLFVPWQRDRLTAVAPYYGVDFDLEAAGIDLEDVRLQVGSLEVGGQYLPYGLEGWEPSILIDFVDPRLGELIESQEQLTVRVVAGTHVADFTLSTARALQHETSVALCVRDENRWLPFYLEYWLEVMKVGQVYLYDNRTRDRAGLEMLLGPYLARGQVTLIDWDFEWRNRIDEKQIGQPPQEGHTLARFGADRWIGFFDADEFLLPPESGLQELLSAYDPDSVGAVSFEMLWCLYKGEKSYREIVDPLAEFTHVRSLARPKTKLFVSPRKVRFMRFHWIQEDQITVPNPEVRYYHLATRDFRFEEGRTPEGFGADAKMDRSLAIRWAAHRARRPRVQRDRIWQSVEECVDHVESAFEEALHGRSALSEDALGVEGSIGLYTRHFYNRLCACRGIRLLEIGADKGASSVAFVNGNRVDATVIDNWVRNPTSAQDCVENLERLRGDSNVELLESNCWDVPKKWLGRYDVYCYDGRHQLRDHERAITEFAPYLADIAVVVIDDWLWRKVREGTRAGLEKIPQRVAWRWETPIVTAELPDNHSPGDRSGWWNGVGVFVLERVS